MKKYHTTYILTLVTILAGTAALHAQSTSFKFPKLSDQKQNAFFNLLMPDLNASAGNDRLVRNNHTVKMFAATEEALKTTNSTASTDEFYWSYVADANRKYIIGLNLISGKSRLLIKIPYGVLPFQKELPASVTDLVKKHPDLTFLYETISPYNSKDRIIEQNLELKSLAQFANDTLTYIRHNFFSRDPLYLGKPVDQLIKDIHVPIRDYRLMKNSENLVFGVFLKLMNQHYLLVFLKNGQIENQQNISIDQLTGEVAMMSVVDIQEQLKRIEQNVRKYELESVKNDELIKRLYML
jgi:hypothetical protein